MKDQILKIAKVKSEKEFYKKYPTEEAFMAKHGKAFKKAAMGTAMVEQQLNQLTDFGNPREAAYGDMLNAPTETPAYQQVSLSDIQDDVMAGQMGITRKQYDLQNQQAEDRNNAEIIASGNKGGGGIGDLFNTIGGVAKQFGGDELSKLGGTIQDFAGAFAYGGEIPQAFGGDILGGAKDWFTGKGKYAGTPAGGTPANFTGGADSIFNKASNPSMLGGNTMPNLPIPGNTAANSMATAPGSSPVTAITGKLQNPGGLPAGIEKAAGFLNKGLDKLGGAGNVISSATNIVKGIDQMKEQKKAIDKADQSMQLSGLSLQAASGPKQIEKHDFDTPYDKRFSQNQTSPSYGTGWNPLTAEDGAELRGYSNTYTSPNTLYSDLGYEPLNDSNIKQYEEGGYVSHNWTPQVITHFGEMTAEDYHKASKEMRTGGSIRENYMFGSDYTPSAANGVAMNGKLATHWGGRAKDVSYNPFSAGTGITSMLEGNLHSESDGQGNTGIGVGYAEDGQELQGVGVQAEAQDGEPMLEVLGPDGKPVAHVAGKIKIPKYVAKHLGDESAAGKTFQKYLGETIVKREKKANKNITEGSELVNNSNPANPIENTKFMAGKVKVDAGNQEFKALAKIKEDAMHWQAAINDTAPKFGYKDSAKFVEDINKGKVNLKKAMMASTEKMAAYGMEMGDPTLPEVNPKDYAEIMSLYEAAKKANARTPGKKTKEALALQKRYNQLFPEHAESIIEQFPNTGIKTIYDNEDMYFGPRTEQYIAALAKPKIPPPPQIPPPPPRIEIGQVPVIPPPIDGGEPERPNSIPWKYAADELINYFDRPLRMDLTSDQLAGEMYALANNQLEPVRSQKINPLLLNPYQISLQDQMNANQADFNAMLRQAGDNPAALSALAAQKYRANSEVKGNEFRTNQGIANAIYNENRKILQDTAFKNMDIMDKQWMLQEEAKANTKATNIAALTSIGDKYAQNAAENFKGAISQNLYPKFRYNASGKAYVVPSLTSPINTSGLESTSLNTPFGRTASLPDGYEYTYRRDSSGNLVPDDIKKKAKTGKNGTTLNGSIVKAVKLKNI